MQNTIVHLIGRPGVGKFTIGGEVARRTGALLVDNHSIANVIFNLVRADGMTPLPAGIWPYVGRVRSAVLDAMVDVAPAGASYVFTNHIRGGDAGEQAAFDELVAMAAARDATFVPVLLTCDIEELMRRVVREERRAKNKLVDPVLARQLIERAPELQSDHPNVLRLNVTSMEPGESAERIIRWATVLQSGVS